MKNDPCYKSHGHKTQRSRAPRDQWLNEQLLNPSLDIGTYTPTLSPSQTHFQMSRRPCGSRPLVTRLLQRPALCDGDGRRPKQIFWKGKGFWWALRLFALKSFSFCKNSPERNENVIKLKRLPQSWKMRHRPVCRSAHSRALLHTYTHNYVDYFVNVTDVSWLVWHFTAGVR